MGPGFWTNRCQPSNALMAWAVWQMECVWPAVRAQPLDILEGQGRTAGNHQIIIRDAGSVHQADLVGIWQHLFSGGGH